MTMHQANLLHTPATLNDRYLLEGPRTLGDALIWVNIQAGASASTGSVWLRDWNTEVVVEHAMPARPGFVFPTNKPNLLIVGCEKVIGTYDLETRDWVPLAAIPDTHPRTIINDGEIVPGGSAIIFGTKDVNFSEPIGQLYLYTFSDGILSILADGMTCSNGKIIRDGFLWDIDTPRKTVQRYRLNLEDRSIEEDCISLDLWHRDDFPDGMIDGGNGSVIIAFYNPLPGMYGEAMRYDLKSGEVIETWHTPESPRVTCPLLVQRPEGIRLILTTAIEGMNPEEFARCPNAGAIFMSATDQDTLPPREVCVL